MKQKFSFILSLIFFLSLAFPGQGVLDIGPAQKNPKALKHSQPVTIKVVQAQPEAVSIAVSEKQAALPTACPAPINQNADLPQNSSLINLNVPANCFSLQLTKLAEPAPRIKVVNLAQPNVKVTVVDVTAEISVPNLKQSPLKQHLPSFPSAGLFLALAFVFIGKKLSGKVLSAKEKIKSSLTLHQLQVLRC